MFTKSCKIVTTLVTILVTIILCIGLYINYPYISIIISCQVVNKTISHIEEFDNKNKYYYYTLDLKLNCDDKIFYINAYESYNIHVILEKCKYYLIDEIINIHYNEKLNKISFYEMLNDKITIFICILMFFNCFVMLLPLYYTILEKYKMCPFRVNTSSELDKLI